MYYLSNKTYWIFGAFFFFYFFIGGAIFPFLPIWLHDVNQLDQEKTGIVFACISLSALICQPVYGFVTDKFGLKKYMLWFIVILTLFVGPLFVFVFPALLQHNFIVSAILLGFYLGLIFNGGAPAIEAYIEKVSRTSQFEYGRARMFGMAGWAICAAIVGYMFTINHNLTFWLSSGVAFILGFLLMLYRPCQQKLNQPSSDHQQAVSIKSVAALFKMRKFWALTIYLMGVASVYDVYDQQFANFFTRFFSDHHQATRAFGLVTTLGEFLNASIMFFIPLVINRIGGKNALLVAGVIMSVRIIGSSLAGSVPEVIILKMLHMFEVPFLLVGLFKYITYHFDVKLSASVYLLSYCFFKQLAISFLSYATGYMYKHWDFSATYLLLGSIALFFTVVSVVCLSRCTTEKSGQKAV